MKIISAKKAAASRANGARSRGPATPGGKARSCRNALRHGLRSKTVYLPADAPEALGPVLDSYNRRLSPRNHAERKMITEIVVAESRHRRALYLETALLDSAMLSVPGNLSGLDRLTSAFAGLAAASRLDTLYRYQVRYSNISHRLRLQYLALRREPISSTGTNEPETPSVCNKSEPSPNPLAPLAIQRHVTRPAPVACAIGTNEPETTFTCNKSVRPPTTRSAVPLDGVSPSV
jgi:hypothetical protein